MSDRRLTFEDFNARLNGRFSMQNEDGQVSELVLLECTRRQPATGGVASFNLLFRAGVDAPAEQGSYLLSAEGFGPAPVFLVPVERTPDGVDFHAVFNHDDGG